MIFFFNKILHVIKLIFMAIIMICLHAYFHTDLFSRTEDLDYAKKKCAVCQNGHFCNGLFLRILLLCKNLENKVFYNNHSRVCSCLLEFLVCYQFFMKLYHFDKKNLKYVISD